MNETCSECLWEQESHISDTSIADDDSLSDSDLLYMRRLPNRVTNAPTSAPPDTELSFESSPYHSKDASANASNDELLLGHGANHWTAYEWLATQLKDLAAPNSLMPYLRSALLPESHPDTNELLAIPDDIRRSTHITQLDPDICSQLCCPAASLYAASETDETFHVWVVVEDELHAFYGWEEQSTPARDGGDEVAQDIKADMSYGDRG